MQENKGGCLVLVAVAAVVLAVILGGKELVIFGAVVGVIVVVLVVAWGVSRKSGAESQYREALEALKQDPNNPDLRQRALDLGRAYSAAMRDNKGYTAVDETSVMNDINAAAAHATVGRRDVTKVEVVRSVPVRSHSVAQEIEGLGQLFLQGAITAEEFERGKATFLGGPPDKAASAVELLKNLDALRRSGVLSESEFNTKKWEILSERLIPGAREVAGFRQSRSVPSSAPAKAPSGLTLACPSCGKGIPESKIAVGQNRCPHCGATFEAEAEP
jgi:hypothetical protein